MAESARARKFQHATEWVTEISRLADKLRSDINDCWDADDLDSMFIGVQGSNGPSKAKLTALSRMKDGLKAILQLLNECSEYESMLLEQTSSARQVAKRAVFDLTVADRKTQQAQEDLLAVTEERDAVKSKLEEFIKTNEEINVKLQSSVAAAHAAEEQRRKEAHTAEIAASQLKSMETQADEQNMKIETLTSSISSLEQELEEVKKERDDCKHSENTAMQVEAVEKEWEAKYQVLESEYKALEPRYQAITEQQRSRIRLLEKQLSNSEQRQKALMDSELSDFEKDLMEARSRIAELQQDIRHKEDELVQAKERTSFTEQNMSEVSKQLQSKQDTLAQQGRKIKNLEDELVVALGAKKEAESKKELTMENAMRLEERSRRLSSAIAKLFTLLNITSRSVVVEIDETSPGIGIQLCERMVPARHTVITDIRPGSPAQEALLMPGDMILCINGDLVYELTFEDITSHLSKCKSIINLVVADSKEVEEMVSDLDEANKTDDNKEDSKEPPLAVLLSRNTIHVGMEVVVRADLVDTTVPRYASAKKHDGEKGAVLDVDEDGTCQVDLETAETWLPIESLVHVTNSTLWHQWLETKKNAFGEGNTEVAADLEAEGDSARMAEIRIAEQERIMSELKKDHLSDEVPLDDTFTAKIAAAVSIRSCNACAKPLPPSSSTLCGACQDLGA
eukprot:m.39893 g.39893  ORF g.39893 m.39893 type:complete len:681 (-) comp9605_c0_seq1:114-2156(-)